MISMIKQELGVDILVGKNGRIWVNGDSDRLDIAVKTLNTIEREAHTFGLTDRSKAFITDEKKRIERQAREEDVE
jgi:exosome complex component RRP4